MLKTLLSLFSGRVVWGLTSIIALSALIWMLGPLLSFTRFQLLSSSLHRQLLIGACFLLWIVFQLIPQLYRAWFNRRLLSHLQLSNSDQAELQATGEMLDERFHDAALMLKKMQFASGASGQRTGFWRNLSGRYLYQLPWYLIVGAPGAGKTTALINSGLEFPLGERFGNNALRGVGGTRHCDWWFTRQAVLLDTAGRYALQESQRTRDASEWQTFISLLKRYRTRQPINGVIMTISVADLLSDSAQTRFAQASALRSRMAELHQQTGIPFPVYVMVTKTDLLKGFVPYFSALDKRQREQILGFTFPLQQEAGRQALPHSAFSGQFSQLGSRLMANLSDKMAREPDLMLRAECFLFPQEFASLRTLLADYLDIVFSPGPDAVAWTPRALFFTSATQEGLPFDRVMGELARKLQLPHAQEQSIASWNSVNRSAPIPATKGQSYFIHDIFTTVIFRESGLAGSDRAWERRHRKLNRVGCVTMLIALLGCCTLWATSYLQNQRYLQQVSERLPAITRQASALSADNHGGMVDLLPFLNSLVTLPVPQDFALNQPPLRLRGGLYHGERVGDAAWGVYQNALKSLLLPRVAEAISHTLSEDSGASVTFSRDALRAYQMLYQPRSYNGKFLRDWVMQNLRRNPSAAVTPQQMQQLEWHLSQLLDNQIQSSPYARNNLLITGDQDDSQ